MLNSTFACLLGVELELEENHLCRHFWVRKFALRCCGTFPLLPVYLMGVCLLCDLNQGPSTLQPRPLTHGAATHPES